MKIDGNNGINSARDRIAAGEYAAVGPAIADRNHPRWVRRRPVGALQRLAHVAGDRAGNEQHVGMARRGDEAQSKALEVVEGATSSRNLLILKIARLRPEKMAGTAQRRYK
jgi:hypothetical protein